MTQISIDGTPHEVAPGDRLIDAINRAGVPLSQVCYLPHIGPIQTCDTCMVEVNGELVRACATVAADGMKVSTTAGRGAGRAHRGVRPHSAQPRCSTARSATTTTATARSTTPPNCSAVEHQHYPFQPKPYEVDNTNPFYRYDPNQCILCGRCVEACQNCK